MDNKFDAILHVLQKRNIWMKNKKKPFCEHAQRTDAYVTGEQKGFDAVIRQIAHFRQVLSNKNRFYKNRDIWMKNKKKSLWELA